MNRYKTLQNSLKFPLIALKIQNRLASVITELRNNMATTEAQVLSNATEIQKVLQFMKHLLKAF
jgi:hypothetical protein